MTKSEKETVLSPSSGEKTLVNQPAREKELAKGFDNIFEEFRSSFDDLMAPFLPMRTYLPLNLSKLPSRTPLMDVIDEKDQYLIRSEIPGFSKEDVNIDLNKDTLILKAEKKAEEEEKTENYIHRERAYASCQRTINFPEEVDPSKAQAKLKNGILELRIPKKEPSPEEIMKKVQIE